MRVDIANNNHTVIDYDEIQQFVNSRYISAPEATWKLLEYPIQNKSHTIVRLTVHLPLQNDLIFRPGDEETVLRKNHETTLTAWFKLSETDEDARTIMYHCIPFYYTWKTDVKKWKKRVRYIPNTIGRIHTVSPREVKRYYLRLLLLNCPGAKGFEDLKTVDCEIFSSFQQAAIRKGLV